MLKPCCDCRKVMPCLVAVIPTEDDKINWVMQDKCSSCKHVHKEYILVDVRMESITCDLQYDPEVVIVDTTYTMFHREYHFKAGGSGNEEIT